MIESIFDKTSKGREEIATRRYGLPPRMRTLLLLCDGKQSVAQIMAKLDGLGFGAEHVVELLDRGFIARNQFYRADDPAATAIRLGAPAKRPRPQQLQAIYDFYSHTIRHAIGLRAYALQLKVERAKSLDDFRLIRGDYLTEVEKAQGEAVAKDFDRRLQGLLKQS